MFEDIEFVAGDEIECSPVEMSYLISQIMAKGGEFYIDGNVLVVVKYQTAPEDSLVLPNISPEPTVYEKTLAAKEEILARVADIPVTEIVTPEVVELPLPAEILEIVAKVAEGSGDLSPAEDLADIEEVVKQEEPEMNTPELDDDADRIVAEFTKPAPKPQTRGRQPKATPAKKVI